ncbi:MAG: lipoyl synthase [Candidatus Gastranaerophilales bacterium]|nr:lipoyl synthase [Candidatus Gastranaerophilales bacterium]
MDKILRLPEYLKTKIASVDNANYKEVRKILTKNNLNTVCDGARCPNKCECYSSKTATFLILGDTCTRNCAFCNISQKTPLGIDLDEPKHVAQAVNELNLEYCVITSVTRDDLKQNNDYGSIHYQNTINEIRKMNNKVKIEVLTPDFKGDKIALDRVVEARPDVFNHNIETIKRLYPIARQMANYDCTLDVLDYMHKKGFITKSGFMLGLGETMDEIKELIFDLSKVNLDILTVGQYIRPSKQHLEVKKYYTLEEYKEIEEFIKKETTIYPIVAPLARSSYKAREAYEAILAL